MKIEKVHSDHRGETHSLTTPLLNVEEVSFFFTKSGINRGGCIHKFSKEHLCVIMGEIKYVFGDDTQIRYLQAGESITIDANVPHYFLSLEDSIVCEWGAPMSEKKEHHPKFRALVNELNSKIDFKSS